MRRRKARAYLISSEEIIRHQILGYSGHVIHHGGFLFVRLIQSIGWDAITFMHENRVDGVTCRRNSHAVLLVPPTIMLRDEANPEADSRIVRNAWPLSMHLLASVIGGWTLTAVGKCLPAPIDLKDAYVQT